MVYNKKSKVYTMKRVSFILICFICTAIILCAGYMLYHNMASEKAVDTLKDSSNSSQSKNMLIVRAKLNMSQGELLDANKVELVEIPAELAPRGAITSFSKLNSMRLKREIAEKEFLNDMDLIPESTFYEEGDRLIEHNFAEGAVPAAVAVGSAIDVKLFIKGGEDSVVISKAVVISRNSNLLSFYMDGREQEFIKEAAAEGMLYAVRYIDNSQRASEVTYVPLYDKERK